MVSKPPKEYSFLVKFKVRDEHILDFNPSDFEEGVQSYLKKNPHISFFHFCIRLEDWLKRKGKEIVSKKV
jgi:hypothetical protein